MIPSVVGERRAEVRTFSSQTANPKIIPLLVPVPKSRMVVIDCQILREVAMQKHWSFDDVRAVLPKRFRVGDLERMLNRPSSSTLNRNPSWLPADFWEMKLGQAQVLEIITQRTLIMS